MGVCLMAAIDFSDTLALMWTILKVAAGLGFVIFVHELGHFLVAKACGVKCEKFYVGFDIPIRIGPIELSRFCRFQWGETEYGIGILPLGGYVKMLGQDDDPRNMQRESERIRVQGGDAEEPADTASENGGAGLAEGAGPRSDQEYALDPRSFPAKSVPQRMLIISAGVIMNLIFAVIFATFAFSAGVPYMPCEIGGTVPGSPAWAAGLEPESKIIQIGENGRRSEKLRFDWDLSNSGVGLAQDKEDLPLLVRTAEGETKWFYVRPVLTQKTKGKFPMIGVSPAKTLTIADFFPETAAAVSKLESGDKIVAVDGNSLGSAYQLTEYLARHPAKPVTVTVERKVEVDGSSVVRTIDVTVLPNPIKRLGLIMRHGPVSSIRPDSPAQRAGFQVGDLLEAIDGQPLGDPMSLPTRLREYYGQEIVVQVRRADQLIDLRVTPEQPDSFDWTLATGFPMAAEALGLAFEVTRTVDAIVPGSPAVASGLRAGDTLTGVQFDSRDPSQKRGELINHGRPLQLSDSGFDWMFVFSSIQYLGADDEVTLVFDRSSGEGRTSPMVPAVTDEWNPERGIHLETKSETHVAESWSEALALGVRQTGEDASKVLRFLKKLVTGAVSPTNLGGPISIAVVAGSEASQGIERLLIFLTFLSANLAVLNFLPIPALDGGHMLFLIAEGVRGKPVDERTQMALTLAGVACLLGLMVFVFGLDIHRIFF